MLKQKWDAHKTLFVYNIRPMLKFIKRFSTLQHVQREVEIFATLTASQFHASGWGLTT